MLSCLQCLVGGLAMLCDWLARNPRHPAARWIPKILQALARSSAMQVKVHLPSGTGCSLWLSLKSPVSELKVAVQRHVGRRFVKLTAKGRRLDLAATLSQAGL